MNQNHGTADQPAPIPNESKAIWELVIEDMIERDNVGRKRYGTPLQAFNGRDSLVDAYQESLDLAVYLKAEIVERRVLESQLKIALNAIAVVTQCKDIDQAIKICLDVLTRIEQR